MNEGIGRNPYGERDVSVTEGIVRHFLDIAAIQKARNETGNSRKRRALGVTSSALVDKLIVSAAMSPSLRTQIPSVVERLIQFDPKKAVLVFGAIRACSGDRQTREFLGLHERGPVLQGVFPRG
jgi:hypothetical protein